MTWLKECLQILYWAYFKPFTLKRYLQAIHPELEEDSNPFALRQEFDGNPQLRRYANQVWWLTALTPLLAVVLITLFPQIVTFLPDAMSR